MKDLGNELAILGINRCLIVYERKGNPSLIKFYKLVDGELVERDYSVRLKGITLSRELKRGRSIFTAESKLRVINKCRSDFGEQLYNIFSIFFNYQRERELPGDSEYKGIALLFSDNPQGYITIDFQQIETKEMVGPRITIMDVFLGKKGEAVKSLLTTLGIGKRRDQRRARVETRKINRKSQQIK